MSATLERNPLNERETRAELESLIRHIRVRVDRVADQMRVEDVLQMRFEVYRMIDASTSILHLLDR